MMIIKTGSATLMLALMALCVGFSCSKDATLTTSDLDNPADIVLSLIDPTLRNLSNILHEDYQGSVRFEHSQYNFGATSRCVSQAVRADTSTVHFTADVGGFTFDLANGGEKNIYKNPAFSCELFGQNANYEITAAETEISGNFSIPSILNLNLNGSNEEIGAGFTLTWNQDPSNSIGVFILFAFMPNNNFHLSDVRGGTPDEELIWYIRTEDTGSYTFNPSDFNQSLPDGSILTMKVVRGNYHEIQTEGEEYILFAHTESTGFVKYVEM